MRVWTKLASLLVVLVLLPSAVAAQAPPIRVGGNIAAPTRTKYVSPVYPAEAANARLRGMVIVEVTVNEQGRVANARILRGIAMLDTAALDAVRQWEYEPTLLNGRPVPVILTATVDFAPSADGKSSPPQPAASPTPIEVGSLDPMRGAHRRSHSMFRSLTDEEAARDPYLLAGGRAGVVQLGLSAEGLYRRITRERTQVVDLQTSGQFTPAILVLPAAGAEQPSLRVRFSTGQQARVSSIEVLDDRYRTATGLGVGTTYAEIFQQAKGAPPTLIAADEGVYAITPEMSFLLDFKAPHGSADTPPAVPVTARVVSVFVPRP